MITNIKVFAFLLCFCSVEPYFFTNKFIGELLLLIFPCNIGCIECIIANAKVREDGCSILSKEWIG